MRARDGAHRAARLVAHRRHGGEKVAREVERQHLRLAAFRLDLHTIAPPFHRAGTIVTLRVHVRDRLARVALHLQL